MMFSFDTLFTALITLTVFYLSSCFSLFLEKKKSPSFRIRNFLLVLTMIYIAIIVLSIALYYYGSSVGFLLTIQNFVQTTLDNVLKSSLPPSVFEAFCQKNFGLIYVCGFASLIGIWIRFFYKMIGDIGILENRKSKIICLIVSIIAITILIFLAIFLAFLATYTVYDFIYQFGFFKTFIVNVIVNFILSLCLFFTMNSIISNESE